jgi:chromate transporter
MMKTRLITLMRAMLKLGLTAFGGPVAAIAMMRQEFVLRRDWLSEDEFLEFWGISTLIPGPNAMEFAIHIGYQHAGWPGMIVAGVSYLLPAMLVVLGLSIIYVRLGALPITDAVLYGIKPVVIAILVWAFIGMLGPRLRERTKLLISLVVVIGYLLGVDPVILMIGAGVLNIIITALVNRDPGSLLPSTFLVGFPLLLRRVVSEVPFTLGRLFLVFLKAGSFMVGSGYVLLAFIQEDLVFRLGWLTEAELLDAIAVGQVTPGPLSTTATFVGYILGGLPAALLATIAMFLPGFLFVLLSLPLLKMLKNSAWGKQFLEGLNFAALGLMLGVTGQIASTALVDPITILIAIVMLIILLRTKIQTHWLILIGGLIGLIKILLG